MPPKKGASQQGEFTFVQISHPSESAAWKKKVRSHAARNPHARRQRVAVYQQSALPTSHSDCQDPDALSLSSSQSPNTSAVHYRRWSLNRPFLPTPRVSPVSLLSAARTDPFDSFSRSVSPWEQKLLDHFLQHFVIKEMACMPSLDLNILGDERPFWQSLSTFWVQTATEDRGMLANVLLFACRHMASVQHRDIYDSQATKYKLESIHMLNQTLSKEGSNISALTITKTLALASDASLTRDYDVAEKHMRAAGYMIRAQDKDAEPSDFFGRLIVWFSKDSDHKHMRGSAEITFGTSMTPIAKMDKQLVYHVG